MPPNHAETTRCAACLQRIPARIPVERGVRSVLLGCDQCRSQLEATASGGVAVLDPSPWRVVLDKTVDEDDVLHSERPLAEQPLPRAAVGWVRNHAVMPVVVMVVLSMMIVGGIDMAFAGDPLKEIIGGAYGRDAALASIALLLACGVLAWHALKRLTVDVVILDTSPVHRRWTGRRGDRRSTWGEPPASFALAAVACDGCGALQRVPDAASRTDERVRMACGGCDATIEVVTRARGGRSPAIASRRAAVIHALGVIALGAGIMLAHGALEGPDPQPGSALLWLLAALGSRAAFGLVAGLVAQSVRTVEVTAATPRQRRAARPATPEPTDPPSPAPPGSWLLPVGWLAWTVAALALLVGPLVERIFSTAVHGPALAADQGLMDVWQLVALVVVADVTVGRRLEAAAVRHLHGPDEESALVPAVPLDSRSGPGAEPGTAA